MEINLLHLLNICNFYFIFFNFNFNLFIDNNLFNYLIVNISIIIKVKNYANLWSSGVVTE